MTQLSYRASAEGTVAETRRRNAARASGDPGPDLHDRIVVDVVEPVLCGIGDLLDLGIGTGSVGIVVADALAAALASSLLTLTGGKPDLAKVLVAETIAEVAWRTLRRIDSPATQIVKGEPVIRPRGRA